MAIINNKRIDKVPTILVIATVLVGVALITQYNRIRAGYYFTEGVAMALEATCDLVLKESCLLTVDEEAFKKAIEDYDKAIKLNPNFARAYYKRGQAKFIQTQYKEALKDYKHAQKLDFKYTKSADFYNELGMIYKNLKDFKTAIDNYTQAIKINSNNANYYYNRGESYTKNKDYVKAIKDYTQAIKINPNNADYYFYRGNSYILNKGCVKAIKDYIKDYTQAIKINPNNNDYYYFRGLCYDLNKDYDKAIKDYTQALQILSNIGMIGVEQLVDNDAQTKVLKVVKPLENSHSPAWKQGVKAGDKILLIDGKNTSNISLIEAINLLIGEVGTKVTLRIGRQGRSDFDITLTRSHIITPVVENVYYRRVGAEYRLGDKPGAIKDLQTVLSSKKRDTASYKQIQEQIRKLQQ